MTSYKEHIDHFGTLTAQKMPVSQRVFKWMVLTSLIFVALFVTFVPWVQTAQGRGQVIALNPQDRVQNVTALVPGRIEEWFVQDGQRVEEGEAIVQLADNDPQLLDRLRAERMQITARIAAAESALETAKLDVTRDRALFDEGLGARREYELARIQVAEKEATLAEAMAELNRIDINLSRQSMQLVTAPRDGVIQRIRGGDKATLVSQGDVLATFAPIEAERVVELYIDGRDVSLIKPGFPVRLEFEGWPAIQFSGWPSVAQGIFDGQVRSIDLASSPNGLFRVLVVEHPDKPAWPKEPFVRLGATVRGWVLMEEVSVAFELWRQLNDFPLQPVTSNSPEAENGTNAP
ncbi:efflux RND transporter periplasmic adaptor subunit [Alterisphingorhabdus coralli]|uniref:HlyD family efflux transporter periplasmic adaptor subunit n=1 Tax=Alterisphingorhabdus coralli TaxID=3071408 RepID=A0AA97F9H6_9SPHN|nr:HlyD family efflux transporter periplasmic adaptor subunit [Parasphingorhabdus sp. SCSIO 66989]WOE74950.1 HlyD family efflux transporter periplasmic adaptor subunit [Parasphingorhabdus sp. SCSIO 66989]